jgi:uncharacterized protein (DUF1330 family)
MIVMG